MKSSFQNIPINKNQEQIAQSFAHIVETRRSVRNYTKEKIPKEVVERCLELALLAPNSSNLQVWEIYWLLDETKRGKLVQCCFSQPAAKNAQEIFVFVARPDLWKRNNQWMCEHLEKNKAPKSLLDYYTKQTQNAYSLGLSNLYGISKSFAIFLQEKLSSPKKPILREALNKGQLNSWAIKSTALAAQTFMLGMQAFGYDTCPMEGLDTKRVKKLLELPKQAQICMGVSAGKRSRTGVYGERFRFDKSHFIKKV